MNKIIKTFKDPSLYTGSLMPIITVYFNPSDFPDKYVGRLWNMNQSTPYAIVKDSLEEVREQIPENMIRLERSTQDDPVIVETWI